MLSHLKIDAINFLKKGIWLYLLLLIFEGALRKWILPGLANPLLVVRDPVALFLLATAIYYRLLNWNIYLIVILLVSLLAIPASLIFGHGNLAVTLFGTRYLLLHFPFIFLIGALFTKSDVEQFGRFLLWLTPIMTLIISLQFYSPQSAWINRGIGGSELGSGFSGALGYFRPSGLFSFTNGNTNFYSLAIAYIVYFWLSKSQTNRLLLVVASISALIALPISISRAYLFQFTITVFFGLIASLSSPKTLARILIASAVMYIGYFSLTQFSFFQIGTEALTARFTGANEHEGGLKGVLGDRFLGSLYNSLVNAAEIPLPGYGLGIGTNTGQRLLAEERLLPFVSTEGEWNRIINEIGPILGLLVVGLRLSLGGKLLLKSWFSLKTGNLLPWMLLSAGLFQITIANWAQPTSLGFFTAMGGLILGSFQKAY